MIEALEALGAEAILCPVIAIEPPPSPEDVLSAIEGLSERDWVVFTSVNGVDRFFEILSSVADARALASCRIACIGPATARALKRWNLRADLLPERYVAEGLIEAFEAHALDGASILIPRAEVAREILPETLRARGAIVDVVPVYRTVPGTPEQSVVQALNAGEVDVITLTASSTATHFRGLFDAAQWSTISKRVCAACIGPITEKTAREVGLEVALTAQIYTVPGLISALVPWWRQQGRGE